MYMLGDTSFDILGQKKSKNEKASTFLDYQGIETIQSKSILTAIFMLANALL